MVSSSGSGDDSLRDWAAVGTTAPLRGQARESPASPWDRIGRTPLPRLPQRAVCPHPRGCCSPASGKGTLQSSSLRNTLTQSSCLLRELCVPGTGVPGGLAGEGRRQSVPVHPPPRLPPLFQIAFEHQSWSRPAAGSDMTALL